MRSRTSHPRLSVILSAVLLLSCSFADALAISAEPPREMLQITSAGHVLGFDNDRFYVASGDHVLGVTFANTEGAVPMRVNRSTDRPAAALQEVSYKSLWPGIDLTYTVSGQGILESTWQIAPEANPDQIRLRYNAPTEIASDGGLRTHYQHGWMRESPPFAWQQINGQRTPIAVAFKADSSGEAGTEIGFELGSYDPAYPLLIDPVMEWNTFTGSADLDDSRGIVIDTSGNIYVVGTSTFSSSWGSPVASPGGGGDAIVAKFDPSGALLWHTFVGNTSQDTGEDIAIDINSNIYITGYTAANGNGDAYAAMLLSANGAINWYRAFGSATEQEWGYSIAVDSLLNTYVAGDARNDTWGSSTIIPNSGWDAFVQKLTPAGLPSWNTFLGGATGTDQGRGVAVDSNANIYVAGNSGAAWGSPVAAHSAGSNFDAFVAKLSSTGSRQWHTFLGFTGEESVNAITTDSSGNSYVVGHSDGGWSASPHNGGRDAFVSKLSTLGAFQWNRFLGSSDTDTALDVAVNAMGEAYVTGSSGATWGSPINTHAGGSFTTDTFAVRLNSGGSGTVWSTFMGSTASDVGYGIAIDSSENAFVAGSSAASWGTPVNAFAGGGDPFVSKICETCFVVDTSAIAIQGSISPLSRVVAAGNTTTFDITAEPGYGIATVSGCGGTWGGNNPYATGPINSDCTVTATFDPTLIVAPTPGPRATLIAGGRYHGLALLGDGSVFAWGFDSSGQATVPPGLGNVIAVASHPDALHSVALKNDGTVDSFGSDFFGQSAAPPGLSGVIAIAAGANHSLALKNDGSVVRWGDSNGGTAPADLGPVIDIAAGTGFSVGLRSNGTPAVWSQFGYAGGNLAPPGGLGDVIDVAAGNLHILALKSDGTVVAWGDNTFGQITVPPGLSGVVAVAGGSNHSLALLTDGTVAAWGHNNSGQSTPPGALADVVAITGGDRFSLALKADGSIVHWGYNPGGITTPLGTLNLLPFHGQNGMISPNTPQSDITLGSTASFTATPETGFAHDNIVTGSCPGGSWSGQVYTTGSLSADCTVNISFSLFTNTPPLANPDSYIINEDTILAADDAQGSNANDDGVLANDTDIDGDVLMVVNPGTFTTAGIGGSINIAADGTFSYTPPADLSGQTSFGFDVTDGSDPVPSSLTIDVLAVNDPPSFIGSGDVNYPQGGRGTVQVTNWASAISPGPADESAQTTSFSTTIVNNTDSVLNSADLGISGTLNLDLSGEGGFAAVEVVLMDDGGGDNQSPPLQFDINVTRAADMAAVIDNALDVLPAGTDVLYRIYVDNAGPADVTGAMVLADIPLELGSATWTCTGSGAAVCGASGNGDLLESVDLPQGTRVTFDITVAVPGSPEQAVTFAAEVQIPGDTQENAASNNVSSDSDFIGVFGDGNEAPLEP